MIQRLQPSSLRRFAARVMDEAPLTDDERRSIVRGLMDAADDLDDARSAAVARECA